MLKKYKNEFEEMLPSLKERYYMLHPNGDYTGCENYISSQIKKRARTLYDYNYLHSLLELETLNAYDIFMAHKSCSERCSVKNYYIPLSPYIFNAKTILDLGCGLNPLAIMPYNKDCSYFCVDKDEKILSLLSKFNERITKCKITKINSDLSVLPPHLTKIYFDFVFVQKLIPFLTLKHKAKQLDNISKVNCIFMFISGSKHSLSTEENISEKENMCVFKFINKYNFEIIERLDWPEEFGYIVKRRQSL